MSDESIEKYIKQLNSNNPDNFKSLTPLSDNVVIVKIWHTPPNSSGAEQLFYFIKNSEEYYTSAVNVIQGGDLHWYTIDCFRRKGILSSAMKQTILPHLFKTKDKIFITIDTAMPPNKFVTAVSFAKSLGFTFHGPLYAHHSEQYILDRAEFNANS